MLILFKAYHLPINCKDQILASNFFRCLRRRLYAKTCSNTKFCAIFTFLGLFTTIYAQNANFLCEIRIRLQKNGILLVPHLGRIRNRREKKNYKSISPYIFQCVFPGGKIGAAQFFFPLKNALLKNAPETDIRNRPENFSGAFGAGGPKMTIFAR